MGGFITYIKAQLLQKYDSQCMLFKDANPIRFAHQEDTQ